MKDEGGRMKKKVWNEIPPLSFRLHPSKHGVEEWTR